MKNNLLSVVAIILSTVSLVVSFERSRDFEQRVSKIIDAKELASASSLTTNLNKSRELMGQPSLQPTNMAGVLHGYLEGMAKYLDDGILDTETNKAAAKK